ncbi:MAG TPA: ATP-binding protein [Burkholderiaceae bacterium]
MAAQQFDRDFTLTELLSTRFSAKLKSVLDAMLGIRWQLAGLDGHVVLGEPGKLSDGSEGIVTETLLLDIEPIGSLHAVGAPSGSVTAIARCIEWMLTGERRYRMAAVLHVASVQADYEALQQKHAALQESEQQYRDLATQLEQRVAQQVDVIARAQRQLYQSEKMASVGSLAAGMAHEINNPIGFIRSNAITATAYVKQLSAVLLAYRRGDAETADRLWRETDVDLVLEDFPPLLKESTDGADRIAGIIGNLRRYAGIDYTLTAGIDLNDAVRAVCGIVRDQAREDIAIELDVLPLPTIECDQGRINQMLLAIMQNAMQAIAKGGTVRVSTRPVGQEIHIAVKDNGCGIAPDALPRIFDPFYTTRDVGKGTGLGLTVCADVAAAHGGRIEVDSTVGLGSTFTICLPLCPPIANGEAT